MKNERVGKQGKTKLMCEITATEKRQRENGQRENSATKIEMVGKRATAHFSGCRFPLSFPFSLFQSSDNNFVLLFFPTISIFVAEFSPCPIFRLPFFSVARFSVNLSNMYRMF